MFLLPIAAHEAGHLIAILCVGGRLRYIGIELKGLCISYDSTGGADEILTAASGPLLGILYSAAVYASEHSPMCEWLYMSAQISLLLSTFNLLPVYPLDGGLILKELCLTYGNNAETRGLYSKVGLFFSLLTAAAGLYIWLTDRGGALFAAGLWLLIEQRDL